MPLKARDVKGSLGTKFGFAPAASKGDRHQWLQVTVQGAAKVAVMFSHGDNDLGDRLLSRICRQLRVTRPYFNAMVGCANSREAYYQKLVDEAKAGAR